MNTQSILSILAILSARHAVLCKYVICLRYAAVILTAVKDENYRLKERLSSLVQPLIDRSDRYRYGPVLAGPVEGSILKLYRTGPDRTGTGTDAGIPATGCTSAVSSTLLYSVRLPHHSDLNNWQSDCTEIWQA